MNKAYSLLEVKSATDAPDGMTIEGFASTPQTDRVGDIVESMGAKFATPLPLFMDHDSRERVGRVTFAKATPTGIPFRAFLPYVKEAGRLKDRVDEAIHSVKYGLLPAVSIGFKALQNGVEHLKGGGMRFHSWEWLELSLVPIPANPAAVITGIKSMDAAIRGAYSGASTKAVSLASSPALPLTHTGTSMNSLQRAEAERAGKMQAAKAMMDNVEKQGLTLDANQQTEYDTILGEVRSLDAHMDRLKSFEALESKTSVAVSGTVATIPQQQQAQLLFQRSNDPKGIEVARIMRCLYVAKGNPWGAAQVAEQIYKDDPRVANHFKATVVAGSTVSGTWGADLMTTDGGPFAAFLDYLRPQTIVGKFGQNGVPALNRVPFYAPVGIQTGGGAGYWVGEGKAKPLTAFDYDKTNLQPLTVANIVVLTKKLFKYAGINADAHIRDQMAQALIGRMDTDFIDPAKAASAGVSPASITNGLSAPNSAGNNADDVREDIRTLMAALTKPIRGLVLIMDSTTALSLSLMTNGLGQQEWPNMTMNGGTLTGGVSVIVSDYVPAVTAGSIIVAVKASEILYADEGAFSIDLSEDATIEMSDAPAGSSVATVAASGTLPVSMFQTNGVAFRVERDVNWARARAGSVALIDTVNYGVGT